MTKARIIEHKRFPSGLATISLLHFAAEDAGRQAVNAQWLWENPDVTGYIYDSEARELLLEPWKAIGGVDALTDGSKIILEIGRIGEMEVDPDFEVYVQKSSIPKWTHELKD